ncbi:MAG: DUF3054 domain-containing protein [Corynebacterium sp.]|nr:DUF3054 domain-containing protein [Corynebacterium sp.]
MKTLSKPSVIIADLVSIGLFALLARIAHRSAELPLNFTGWLSTSWPFWLGALVGHLLLMSKTGQKPKQGFAVWLPTLIIGLAIWGLNHHKFPHWSFMIVAGSMSALLLFGWRGIYAAMAKKDNK